MLVNIIAFVNDICVILMVSTCLCYIKLMNINLFRNRKVISYDWTQELSQSRRWCKYHMVQSVEACLSGLATRSGLDLHHIHLPLFVVPKLICECLVIILRTLFFIQISFNISILINSCEFDYCSLLQTVTNKK